MWDFEKNSREALKQLFYEAYLNEKIDSDFETFINVYETINHQLWHQYHLHQTTKEELRYQRFHQTFLHFNYQNINLAHTWADDYLKISPYKTHLIDGTLDVLNYLHERYQLHIITNGFKEVQDIKLKESNLKQYFKKVIISEEHGFHKPDIQIFNLAQQLANTNKDECVMIGDNFDTDIKGAINAEWKAIFLSEQDVNDKKNAELITIKKLDTLKTIF